ELTWHFVGRVQANKTRPIAEAFAWVHALDRLRIAERLAAQRPFHAPPLNVCLPVNLAQERTKGGVTPAELPQLAAAVARLSDRAWREGAGCVLHRKRASRRAGAHVSRGWASFGSASPPRAPASTRCRWA